MTEQLPPADGLEGDRTSPNAQTLMLANMLDGAGVSLRQLLEAASLAGLVQPGVPSSDGIAPVSLPPVLRSHGSGTSACGVTVRAFYEETVAPIARAASGAENRGGGMFRTYEPYWKMLVYGYPYQRTGSMTRDGDRVGADPVPSDELLYPGMGGRLISDLRFKDLDELVGWCKIRAQLAAHRSQLFRERRGRHVHHTDQSGAERNAVGALRYFFKQAIRDGQISADKNLALQLKKPGKKPSNRRALTASEYAEVWEVIASGGDDPELDCLLAETILITGARREGLINLNLSDLDDVRVTIMLDEKGGHVVEQPATLDLIVRLRDFARRRGSVHATDPVFCYLDSVRRGRPHRLTSRRFDNLHNRIQEALPWADRVGFSCHWLRHHSITAAERLSSEAVAAAFARHAARGVTGDYDKASGEEVCAVVGLMTGTEHPLAAGGW